MTKKEKAYREIVEDLIWWFEGRSPSFQKRASLKLWMKAKRAYVKLARIR